MKTQSIGTYYLRDTPALVEPHFNELKIGEKLLWFFAVIYFVSLLLCILDLTKIRDFSELASPSFIGKLGGAIITGMVFLMINSAILSKIPSHNSEQKCPPGPGVPCVPSCLKDQEGYMYPTSS